MVLTTPEKRMAHDPAPCLPFQLTLTRFSPAPYMMISRWRGVRFFQGLSSGMLNSRETALATLAVQPLSRPARSPHGSMAPSLIDRLPSGTIRSGSISRLEPRPLQSTHIPSGLLNENDCGDSSGSPTPQSGQARASL